MPRYVLLTTTSSKRARWKFTGKYFVIWNPFEILVAKFSVTYLTAFMNEFMLNDQCGTSNNLIFSCILDDRHKIVATSFHSMKSTEELRVRNITNARQLREQFQKTTIVVSFQQWPHNQPWFTRIDGSNWWIEFGDRFAPVQFIQQITIVQCLFSLKKMNYFIIVADVRI